MTRRPTDDALRGLSCGFTLAQLPMMLALIAYREDPTFAMYTTNLRNVTTREMDVEVEDASVLYVKTCTRWTRWTSRSSAPRSCT